MVDKYEEQFLRVERWFTRLQDAAIAKSHARDLELQTEYFRDELYAFFINCYHLKDWIEKDDAIKYSKSDVESFIANSDSLKLCADLCNSSKHLTLWGQGKGRSGLKPKADSQIITTRVAISPNSRKAESSILTGIRFVVELDSGGYIDSLELAAKCLEAWDSFLSSYISKIVVKIIEKSNNQELPGEFFSSHENVKLPCIQDKNDITLNKCGLGITLQIKEKSANLFVITRLKAAYSYAEDRQKTRGGLLYGMYSDKSINELITFSRLISPKMPVWLILALEDSKIVKSIAEDLEIYVSNMEQLTALLGLDGTTDNIQTR